MEPDLRAIIEAQILKKRPPKLKSVDRTLSLAVDNYLPNMDPMMLDDEMMPTMVPPPLSVPASDGKKPSIFYVGGPGSGSGAMTANYPEYHSHHGHAHGGATKKPNIRRSDTLDPYTAEMFEMRKTNSFNSNEAMVDDMQMASRRTNSMRNAAAAGYPQDFDVNVIEDKPVSPLPSQVPGESSTRRNCRMHKSLYDPHRRHDHSRKEQAAEAMKCHSVGDDDELLNGNVSGGAKRKLSPKFNSAGASLENEVFHSRSNSRSRIDVDAAAISPTDAIEVSTIPKKMVVQQGGQHKHSSHSLDKAHNFRRIARATQSFYLNPNSYDELRLQRATMQQAGATGKKMHSASMRTKPFRETLTEAKKSKSFVADPYGEYDLSPHRRESKMFVSADGTDIKKSPRLSSALHGDGARASYELTKGPDFDPTGLDYDAIMRAYRQNRRKSSVASVGKKKKKSSIDDDAEMDSEATRKRKKIVCIIVTVFLSLVFASVFVVVFTLTHSTVSTVQNQTKKTYTFSRDREMPLHYNGKPIEWCLIFVFLSFSFLLKEFEYCVLLSDLILLHVARRREVERTPTECHWHSHTISMGHFNGDKMDNEFGSLLSNLSIVFDTGIGSSQ